MKSLATIAFTLLLGLYGCSGSVGDNDAGQDAGQDAGGDEVPDAGGDGGSPLDLPLLHLSDFDYQGAFRLPAADYGISSMNYSEGPLAYDPAANSIFIVGHAHHQAVAEFLVPALVDSTVIGVLNMARDPVQTFVALLDQVAANPQQIDRVGGMALIGGPSGVELLVNVYEYYDAPGDNTHTTLVVRSPDDLPGSVVDGFYSLAGRAHASGWVSPIPSVWQTLLGETHITGSSSGMWVPRRSPSTLWISLDQARRRVTSLPPRSWTSAWITRCTRTCRTTPWQTTSGRIFPARSTDSLCRGPART